MSTPLTCWNTHFFAQEKEGLLVCSVSSIHGSPPKLSLLLSACPPHPPPPLTVLVFRGDLGVLANASQMASVWVEVNNLIFLSLRTQDSKEKNNNAAHFRASKALKQSVKCCSVANLPPHPPRLTPGRHHPLPSSPTRHHQDRC